MQSDQTTDSTAFIWTICRVIGVINFIIFILSSLSLLFILVDCLVYIFGYIDSKREEHQLNDHIILFLLLIVNIPIHYYLLKHNYLLLKQKTPDNGTMIKTWLYLHLIVFIICLVEAILLSMVDSYQFLIFYSNSFTFVVLLIEIIIVYMFYKQITSFSGRGTSSYA